MPRGPQDVRAQNGTLVEQPVEIGVRDAVGALAKGPLRSRIVLRLDCAEARHGVDGGGEAVAHQSLGGQPPDRDSG